MLVVPIFNYVTLCLTFIIFGACLATQDVAMNSHAIVLAHESSNRYMSTFHATFSMGALFGGILGGYLSQQNKSIFWQCALIAMLIIISNFIASKYGPMNLIIGGVGIIFGWLSAGIGLSTVIPMLFSQAGEIAKSRFVGQFAPAEGVAMVSGPPTLGFLGDAIRVRWAMLVPK